MIYTRFYLPCRIHAGSCRICSDMQMIMHGKIRLFVQHDPSAGDGPAQPKICGAPRPGSARSKQEQSRSRQPRPEPRTGARAEPRGGGTGAEPWGAESWLGLRAAPLGITNNLTIGIPRTHPLKSKKQCLQPVLDMTLGDRLLFFLARRLGARTGAKRLVPPKAGKSPSYLAAQIVHDLSMQEP